MKLRFAQCLGLAVGACLSASALGQYALSLETVGSCHNSSTLTVNVKLASASTNTAAGAQVFLTYASGLSVTSITPGPDLQSILSFSGGGLINIAVGTTNQNQVISVGDTLATIQLSTGTNLFCAQSGLVAFRSNIIPTRLTNNQAQALLPLSTSNLGTVTLNDTTAPVISGGPTLPTITANADNGVCTALISVSSPSTSDNCGTPSVVGSRSDMLAVSAPYPVGTTTITWTATDACGNTSTATQSVVVTDTQGPVITCGATIVDNTDLGQCSRVLTVTPPSATDNCGTATVSFDSRSDSLPLSAPFPKGTTTITWKATDGSNLMTTCTQDVIINDNEAPSVTAPSNISQNADAGTCTLTLSAAQLGSPTVSDNCPGPYSGPIASLSLNGPAISFPFAFPTGSTTVFWRATDASGNVGQATQTVTVNPFNTVVANVQYYNITTGSFTRCIDFKFYTGGPCGVGASVSQDVNFVNGSGSVSFNVPCGSSFIGATAADPKHTLRRPASVAISGSNYVVDFTNSTGDARLIPGNINNDEYIDILDFGGYIGQFSTNVGANTTCGYVGLHADFSGNGTVGTEDFTFIQAGFLAVREPDPCGGALQSGPISDVSVADLVQAGLTSYVNADRNLDWRVNAADIAIVAASGLPVCVADFNGNQAAEVQDIFDYLNAWFTMHPRCDIDNAGGVNLNDLFGYLNLWFGGC